MKELSLEDQIKEIRRELLMRRKVYTKKVNKGTLKAATARKNYDAMKAVLNSLIEYKQLMDSALPIETPGRG